MTKPQEMLDLPKGFPSRFGLAFVVLPLFVLLASVLSAQSIPTGALPTGANVLAGNADVSSLGDHMLIRQVSPRAAIRWNDFNVGSAASVQFLQPNANAAILNQVNGSNPTHILGRLRANGNVFITNGNGVFFGEQATVDVGGLVASTMNLAVKDFMNGKLTFKGENGDGEIWNKGRLSADPDGFIALLAPEVRNSGLILAKKGTVALASGKTVELQFGPQRKLEGIRVQPAKWKTLVENQHVIDAEEGLVVLSAKGLTSLRGSVVNNSGKIQARGVRRVGGRIMLTAGEGGEVQNQGLLDVSSLDGRGGEAILEGERLHLDHGSLIDASGRTGGGVVLAGGDWQGGHVEEKRLLGESFSMSEAGEVVMEKGARIDASAIENGKGGDVVLWSDITDSESSTIVRGSIDARGGANGGDGGEVETSGARLDMNEAFVSTFSPYGKSGNWLLDPGNINIISSGTVTSLPSTYEAPADTTIQPSAIESALNSNNLTIQTGSGGHYIEVTDPIDFTNNSSRKLVLDASGDIRINNYVTVNGGVDLIAGGSINVGQNVTTVSGGVLFQATNNILLGTGGANVRVATGSGPITLRADRIAFDGDLASAAAGRTTLATTGLLKIEPSGANFHADFLGGSDGSSGTEIKWKGSLTEAPSGVFKFTGDATSPFRFLEIEDYTRLGGISLNKANSTTPVKIETYMSTAGPITVNGGDLTIEADLTTSSGGVTLQSAGKLALGANDTSMRIASGNTPITLKSDWIAFDGSATAAGNGQTTLASTGILTIAPFNANFSADFLGGSDGSSGSELNWNGSLTEVSSGVFQFTGDGSNDFRHLVIEDYTRFGGIVLNKNNSSTPVEIETNMDFNGPITVYGGDLTIEENLSSRLSGADILLKGTGKVQSIASRTIQANNGDIVFWSDSDGNGEGAVLVGNDNVLNSANGRTGDTDSSGGKIILGGGGNAGVTPTGNSASATQPGVKLGTSTANHTQIYSGGGNISIKGTSTATGLVDDRDEAGIYQWGRMTMKSGRGSITINGTSSEYSGVGFTDPVTDTDSGTKQLIMKSAKTSGTAIQITGLSSAGKGVSFNYQNPKEILSLGGGQIIVTGTGAGVGNYGVSLQNQDILSTSGDISVIGLAGGVTLKGKGARFGSRSGSGITSSTADFTLRGDVLEYENLSSGFTNTFTSSGWVVMESQNTSFSSLFDYKNFDLASTTSSLRIGKTTNNSDVSISSPISISGPISIYGNEVNTDADITISGGGATFAASDALLFGASGTNVRIATGSGSITLKSDWIAFDGHRSAPGSGQTTLALTGTLKIEPYNANFRSEFLGGSDGSTGSILNWNGTVTEVSSGVFSFTGDGGSPFRHLVIEDYTRIGGFILNKDSSVTPVEIETYLDANGPLTIYGGDVDLEADLSSRLSGADVLIKGTGKVETIASRNFQTNNGDVTFWSNSDNSAGGPVVLGDDVVINSANGRTGDSDSGGGKITIGGGNNSGVVPTGYSSSSTQPGVKLGTTTANHTQIYSGGGNISIKGSSTATGLGDDRDEAGVYQWGRMTMKSGLGSITFNGTSAQYQGVGFVAPASETDTGTKQLIMSSAKTSGTAISITGSSSAGTGVSFNYQNPKEILSLGGGQIYVNGTGVGSHGISLQNQDVLSSAGSILLYGGTEGIVLQDRGARFGSRSGSSVTNGSAALTLRGDVLDYQALSSGFTNTADGTGGVVMESHSSSFSSPFDYKNFDLGSTISSLRVGKTTNTANVTTNVAISIAGPITLYGGDVTLREHMSSSLSGADVLIKGTGKVETIASRNFQTNNGDVTFWSNSDNSAGGPVVLGDDVVINSANGRTGDSDSGGGKITIGGGNNSGVVPTGYSSSSTQPGVKLGTTTANHTQMYSGGGNISVKGSSTATGLGDDRDEAGVYQWGRMTMKSGLGSITFNGTSAQYQGVGFVAPASETDTGTKQLIMSSAKTSGTAISITGSSSAGTGVSFNYQNPKEILSLGGGQIYINGTGAGAHGISLQNQDVLSSAGSILLYGGTEGIVLQDRGARFGSRSGSSVTNGSAALTLRGDVLDYQALSSGFTNTADGTGGVVMESHSSSFSSPFDYKNFDLESTVSSLRVGKTTNTANVIMSSPVAITGSISINGGDIDLNAALTATGNSISLDGSGTVRDGVNGILSANGLALLDGAVSLDHTNNDVDLLAGSNLDSLSYLDADDLEVGTVNPSGISSTGDISISTLLGNLEISQNITSGSSTNTSVVLNAARSVAAGIGTGGDVIITGTPTVSSAGGRVTFYSGSAAGSTGLEAHVGSGSGRFRYNSDESATNFTAPLSTGSYAIYRDQPVATIQTMNLAATYQDSLPTLQSSGTLNGDAPVYAIPGRVDSSSGNIKAGSYSINSDNLAGLGYSVVGDGTGTLTINPKVLSVTGLSAVGKTYDGTLSAGVTGTATISGFGSDLVSLNGSPVASFVDKNVGVNKSISIAGYSLSGVDSGNYVLPSSLNLNASITGKPLSITGLTFLDKVYDGGLSATVNDSVAVKTGLVAGDQVSVVSSGTFADKNVGVGKAVTISNQFTGTDAGNYVISGQTSGLASITPKALSITGITAGDKVYDGGLTAPVDLSSVIKAGLVSGDVVTLSSTGSFSDKHVGEGKTVAFSNVYAGSDVGNYTITGQTTGTASITRKNLSISGLKALDKVYDGGLSANVDVSSAIKDGLVAGDEVNIASTGTFSDKRAGQGKALVLSNEFSGRDVGNYDISAQGSGVASIMRKVLLISGIQALDKDYDGSDSVDVDLSSSLMTGLIQGDEVTFVSTGKFSDKSAGSAKGVSFSNEFSGSDLGNYEVKDQTTALASIKPRTVKVFGGKTFDGKRDLSGDVTIETGVEGETLSYTGALAVTASVAGPDGVVGTMDNHIESITLLDASDGSGGLVSNYALPELNALNAPVEISASTIIVEEAVSAQLVDLSTTEQDAFTKNVEYGINVETTSVSVEASLLQAAPSATGGSGTSGDGIANSETDLGLKIEMVSQPDAVSAGIVAVTIPQGTAVAGTGFSFGLPEEISSLVSSSGEGLQITLESGAPLPSWIEYNAEGGKFVSSSVPDGAFPIKVVMNVDGKKVAIVISESQE